MGEFKKGYVYTDELNSLRMSTHEYPLELQLIWLFEIFMILTYRHYVKTGKHMKYNPERDCYIITGSKCIRYISTLIPGPKSGAFLSMFRNIYVHRGCLGKAEELYKELVDNHKDDLNKLAGIAHTTLNWGYSLCGYEDTL